MVWKVFKEQKTITQINNETKTAFESVTCGGPQGSILDPLLLLIHVNDHQYVSNLLKPIMFVDDADLF